MYSMPGALFQEFELYFNMQWAISRYLINVSYPYKGRGQDIFLLKVIMIWIMMDGTKKRIF